MARYRKTAPRRRRPVDGRRAPDGVGVHGDPCPGDVDTVGRDMAHGVGLDGRVSAGMTGDLAPVRWVSWTALLPAVSRCPPQAPTAARDGESMRSLRIACPGATAQGPSVKGRFLVIVATPELFGSCDGSRSAGSGTTDDEREQFARSEAALSGSDQHA